MKKFLKFKKLYLLIIIISIPIILFLFIKFNKNDYKILNNGNTNINQTLDDIKERILGIEQYEAKIEVTVNSNKNTNKYIMEQSHTSDNIDTLKIIEPTNLSGVEITYNNGTLEVKNTKLNLSKIYNNYPYIEDNNLWLNSFINDYKNTDSKNINIDENENEIIIELNLKESDKIKYKTLYLDKKTVKPSKLILQNDSKEDRIIIIYNEITIK